MAILLLGLSQPSAAGEPLRVAASIPPHGWLVEQIGGNRVEVMVLVTPGDSPATFQPTDAQVTRLLRSQLYFRTGVPFERGEWFEALQKTRRMQIEDLRSGIELRGEDPHIWLSPRLLEKQVAAVGAALASRDANHRREYEANVDRLRLELGRLDRRIRARLEPFAGRTFFVFHPSWGYFAEEYGLRQIAVEYEGKDPSDRELTQLQGLARRERISVVFVQPQIQGRGAQAVAAAVGGRLAILDPLAPDVLSNLEAAAKSLAATFSEARGDDR